MKTVVREVVVVYVIPFVGTYAFALLGCIFKEERKNTASFFSFLLSFLVSHGGGMTRDLLSMLVVREFILPAAASSYDSWVAWLLAFTTYAWLKKSRNYHILENHNVTLVLGIIDAAAVANYTVIGAYRCVSVYGYSSPGVVFFLSALTALGGGLWTMFLWRPNKMSKLSTNSLYYLTTCLCACVAARMALVHYTNYESVSFLMSIISATVYWLNYIAGSRDHSWKKYNNEKDCRVRGGRPTVNRFPSFGRYFMLVRNPFKGIRLYKMVLLHHGQNIGADYYFMITGLA